MIYSGNNKIVKIYKGENIIHRIYKGNTLIFPVLFFANNSNRTEFNEFNTTKVFNPIMIVSGNTSSPWDYIGTVTRDNGIIDFSNSTGFCIFVQNTKGKIILQNGSINELDGMGGFSNSFSGTIDCRNINITTLWTDGHNVVINGGYYKRINNGSNSNSAPNSVTINNGFFDDLTLSVSYSDIKYPGTYILNGGYFKQNINTSYIGRCRIILGDNKIVRNSGNSSYPYIVDNV